MKPCGNINGLWELRGYSDADYAGDNDTWKTMTGYIVLINGEAIDLNSLNHKRLHYLLQKLNIQQSRRYFAKYYFLCNFIVYGSYC